MSNVNPDFSVRDAVEEVSDLYVQRWSPRAYVPRPIAPSDLETVFDAARWSPSCYNEQPWQFLTSTDSTYSAFLNLLVPDNQAWAQTAPLIGFVIATKQFSRNGKDNFHAAFDTGAAWMAMSLQASQLGLYAHGMGGIHYDEVYKQLDVNAETHQVICGFTLGYIDVEADEEITTRKPLDDIWRKYK